MARYNFLASGYAVTDEIITRTSSTSLRIRHDLIKATGFEIWTGAGKTGTQLTLTTDYTLTDEDADYTTEVGSTVYTKVAIVNGAYHSSTLYLTYTTVGDYNSVENTLDIAHPIGDVIFQGPNDADPATLYPGTTWDDVSWEEANMTRRTAGDLAGARFTGVPAHLAVSVTGGVPTVSITNGGSGYLSGGSGTITLTLVGTCTTQATRTATVTSGVVTAINVVAAGAGYTSGAIAIYDGVVGHGDLTQRHYHVPLTFANFHGGPNVASASGGSGVLSPNTVNATTGAQTSDGANGTARSGAETSGSWVVVNKWRRTA